MLSEIAGPYALEIKLLLKSFSQIEPYEACNLPCAFEKSTFETLLKGPGLNLKAL